jgi:plastocyanin
MRERVTRYGLVLGVLCVLAAGPAAAGDGWGAIKGQVVWAGPTPFTPEKLKVDKDQGECLKNGDLLSEKYVVDPKTKGVRWVMVWLIDPKNPKAALPIKPELKEVKPKKLVLDQPTCQFTPHVLGIRQGQELEVKNPAKVAHNTYMASALGPNLNQLIPPGKSLEIAAEDFHANSIVSVSCTIHGWMKGTIRVFNHPYFAVTDEKGNFEIKGAPAGNWNLVIWQDEGWVTAGGKLGMPVTIKADGTTDLGKIELKP